MLHILWDNIKQSKPYVIELSEKEGEKERKIFK